VVSFLRGTEKGGGSPGVPIKQRPLGLQKFEIPGECSKMRMYKWIRDKRKVLIALVMVGLMYLLHEIWLENQRQTQDRWSEHLENFPTDTRRHEQ